MVFCAGGQGETPKGIARFWVVGSAGKVHINDDNDGNDNHAVNDVSIIPTGPCLLTILHGNGSIGQPPGFVVRWRVGDVTDRDHNHHAHKEDEQTVVLEEDVVDNPEERTFRIREIAYQLDGSIDGC